VELVRVCVAPQGAFGVLLRDGVPLGPVTLERTYPLSQTSANGPQFVKIPAGRYRCLPTRFLGGGYQTYEVTGVLGHSRLLFHRLNTETESEGCIGVGQRFGRYDDQPAILQSNLGFTEFWRSMPPTGFNLTVRGA
jgi:hypothetical protein